MSDAERPGRAEPPNQESDRHPLWDIAPVCAFCGQDRKAQNGTLGSFLGPLDDGNRNGVGVYVHRFCALWSSEVRLVVSRRSLSLFRARAVLPPSTPRFTSTALCSTRRTGCMRRSIGNATDIIVVAAVQ